MKLTELSKEEFAEYALNHVQNNFHQTIAWGELKYTNGWHNHYVGLLDDNNSIVGASLLLSKKVIGKINITYAPRGFLLNYHDYNLLKIFTKKITKYAKKKGAIFVKIDPYVMYKERDIDGNIVEGGIDNSIVIDNLKKLGYVHKGFTVYHGTLQPRWMFVLDLEGKTEKQILQEMYLQMTKRIINKTSKLSFDIIEASFDDIKKFKDITSQTGKRRGFIDRPLSYYQKMYDILSKHKMIKILLVALNCDKSIAILKQELIKKEKLKEENNIKLDQNPNNKKAIIKNKELDDAILDLKNKISEFENLMDKHGSKIIMAGSMFITYGDEVLYLHSGAYQKFLKYDAPYVIQWEMIKYALKHGYKRYNFYGISGSFDKNDKTYGVYHFKKGFNGKVVELIGEFDLVINKPIYYLYNFAYKIYRYIKNVKNDR